MVAAAATVNFSSAQQVELGGHHSKVGLVTSDYRSLEALVDQQASIAGQHARLELQWRIFGDRHVDCLHASAASYAPAPSASNLAFVVSPGSGDTLILVWKLQQHNISQITTLDRSPPQQLAGVRGQVYIAWHTKDPERFLSLDHQAIR